MEGLGFSHEAAKLSLEAYGGADQNPPLDAPTPGP